MQQKGKGILKKYKKGADAAKPRRCNKEVTGKIRLLLYNDTPEGIKSFNYF